MQLMKLSDNLLLFTSESQKELALTFFRVEEYYESQNVQLNGQTFSVFEFLDEMMDDKGNIDYFSFWDGFNIPGSVYMNWLLSCNDLTHYEKEFYNEIKKLIDVNKDFYIIGVIEKDKHTLKHEIAHALYYLNKDYKEEINGISLEMNITEYFKVRDGLIDMEYDENVLIDEIQAYMATSTKRELVKWFDLDFKIVSGTIKKYRKVFEKYNTYEILH